MERVSDVDMLVAWRIGVVGVINLVVFIGAILLRLQNVDTFNELLARKIDGKQMMNPSPSTI